LLTPKEKLESVERQINECMEGKTTEIVCPFCLSVGTAQDRELCCPDMGLAVRAILRRQAQKDVVEQAIRVMDAVSDQAARN
jgi:hypothetical protein